jgi:hypothetical protein
MEAERFRAHLEAENAALHKQVGQLQEQLAEIVALPDLLRQLPFLPCITEYCGASPL